MGDGEEQGGLTWAWVSLSALGVELVVVLLVTAVGVVAASELAGGGGDLMALGFVLMAGAVTLAIGVSALLIGSGVGLVAAGVHLKTGRARWAGGVLMSVHGLVVLGALGVGCWAGSVMVADPQPEPLPLQRPPDLGPEDGAL